MAEKNTSMAKRILIALAVIIVLLASMAAWYVNDYYHADSTALATVADENGSADGVVVRELSDKAIAFVPDNPTAGLVFYPGAKVQPEAYAPLMQDCAEQGILCVLLKPTFNLALIDVNAADGVTAQFPEVNTWLIGGHSMGGVAASSYLSDHADDFDGIVFLASYPSNDLSAYNGAALSVAGDLDHVLNRDNYEQAKSKLPADSVEMVIAGGNHDHFGNYGDQAGDGTATISRENQQEQTADAIADLAKAA